MIVTSKSVNKTAVDKDSSVLVILHHELMVTMLYKDQLKLIVTSQPLQLPKINW